MRHAYLCGDAVRLEFFPDKGVACASVTVDGDFEDRVPAHCDVDNLRAVVGGLRYHLAAPGWLCSLAREGDQIELELWRDGAPKKRCTFPLREYEQALEIAFGGARSRAYVA